MATIEGKKTGGRKKGSLNKKTVSQVKAAEESGLMPVDFLLLVMRETENDMATRMDAAKAAAPYLTAKLAPKTEGDGSTPPEEQQPIKIEIGVVDGRKPDSN